MIILVDFLISREQTLIGLNVGEINSRITSFEEALDGGQIQGSVQITAESIVVDPILEW